MAGLALKSQWRCIERSSDCTEHGEGTGRQVDLAARKHERALDGLLAGTGAAATGGDGIKAVGVWATTPPPAWYR